MVGCVGRARRLVQLCCGCRAEPRCPERPCTSYCLPAAINEGAEQLEVQARILAFVLANANSKLLKAHGPLQVVGTVEMAGSTPSPAQRQH